MQEAKDRSIKKAQEAAEKRNDTFSIPDPNNPYNLEPGGVMGRNGPFTPKGPFGGDSIGFGPEGDGGIGD